MKTKGLLTVCVLCAFTARANVINFDDLTFADYDPVPTGYKSNDLAGGTPDIAVNYQTVTTARAPFSDHLDLWHTDYGDLVKVAFPSANGNLGDVILTPSSGFQVTLASFDLGGWPQTTQSGQTVRILDGTGNILLDYSPFNITGSGHNTLAPNLTSTGPLIIEFGTSWNGAIDNIVFSESAVTAGNVGAPDGGATALLLAGSLSLFGFLSRKLR